jgi:hypothetical protein
MKMIGWKEVATAVFGATISGAIWVGSETVESKALHAAQKVESAQHNEELDKHENRLSDVEKAIISITQVGQDLREMTKELKELRMESKKR